MKHHFTLCAALAVATLGAASCTRTTNQEQGTEAVQTDQSLSQLFENYYEDRLKLFPLEATAIADKRYNDQLPNNLSQQHIAQVRQLYQTYLDRINRIDRSKLGAQEQISYDIFRYEMQMSLEGWSSLRSCCP